MAVYDISQRGWGLASLGFGVCVGAFMLRLLSDILEWPWLRYLVMVIRLVGLLIIVWGITFGWIDARAANGAPGPTRESDPRVARSGIARNRLVSLYFLLSRLAMREAETRRV
jgi:hypothetical protein